MKKTSIITCVAALAIVAACNMNGMKLHADGDSDNGSVNPNKQQTNFELETDFTAYSQKDINVLTQIRGLGYTEDQSVAFIKIRETKIQEGNNEDWANAYAFCITEGKSEQQAIALANSNRDENEKMYNQAYAQAIKKGPEFAKKYAGVYVSQKRAGRDDNWASLYANVMARGKSVLFAHLYAKKRTEGKSKNWANSYADTTEKYHSGKFATRVADIYTQKVKLGMPKKKAEKQALEEALKTIDHKIDINSQDENGDTDLIKAVREGDITWAVRVINAGASCNIQNQDGQTALMIAAQNGQPAMVALLLSTDPTGKNLRAQKGTTALTFAKKAMKELKKTPKTTERNKKIEQYRSIIEVLKDAGGRGNGIHRFIQQFMPKTTQVVGLVGLAMACA